MEYGLAVLLSVWALFLLPIVLRLPFALGSKWRLRLAPGRLIDAVVYRGREAAQATVIRGSETRQVRLLKDKGKVVDSSLHLVGGARDWPDQPTEWDWPWLARLAAAYYGLSLEIAEKHRVPAMSQEEEDDFGVTPRGSSIRAHPGTHDLEVTIRLAGQCHPAMNPVKVVLGIGMMAGGAALVVLSFAECPLWLSLLSLPVAALIGLAGPATMAFCAFGRYIIELDPDRLRQTKVLFGRRFGTVEMERSQITEVRRPKDSGTGQFECGLDFGGAWLVPQRIGATDVNKKTSLWLGKVVAKWAGVPLRWEE